jgi:polyisoprenyl-phosphate glycosyltransferase
MTKPQITVVCPIHNEELSIPLFYERFKTTTDPLQEKFDFQILFTNNRSTDGSAGVVQRLIENDPRVEVLTFSRNFGYQASITAGLTYARGDAILIIDVDCEDPPELIPVFLSEWEKGVEIVYGIRYRRAEPVIIQWMRRLFYRILQRSADTEIILDMAEFSLISAHVRDFVIRNQSTFPFVRTDIAYVGFERKGIEYQRQGRSHGRTHYNFLTMTAFAIGGILSSSTYLLRLAAFIGAGLLLSNLPLLIGSLLYENQKLFQLLVSLDLMYIVFFVAVIAVYTARIYKNGVNRPLFIIDWKHSVYRKPE